MPVHVTDDHRRSRYGLQDISETYIMVEGVEFIRNQAVREVSTDWQSTEFGIWVDRRILRRILNGRLDAVLLF